MAQTKFFAPPEFSPMRVRVLSLLALVALLVGSIGPILLPVDGNAGPMVITRGIGWMLAAIVAAGSPGWRHVTFDRLDERERAERERAVVVAHRISGVAMCLSYMWLLLATRGTLWVPDHVEAAWLMAMLFWVHVMVPGMILAWRAPADEED